MYGMFTYIYHKNQPNVGNIPYMDAMGLIGFQSPPRLLQFVVQNPYKLILDSSNWC